MPFTNIPANRDRELNDQLLDVTKISDWHEWDVYAQTETSFRHNVEENSNLRADMARYKLIADVNVEGARSSFSRETSSTTLFKIPNSIPCDRTFARDAYDAYYLDAMSAYLILPASELRVEDIPLMKIPLQSRFFCAFSKRPTYFNELYERRRSGHWVPGDSPDLEFFSDLDKASWFPKVEAWLLRICQPCALPIPVPPSLYYYHIELRNAQRYPHLFDSERVRRLRFCVEKEYYMYFLAMWWNELMRGGKAFVIHPDTISILNFRCGTIADIVGKPAQAILERMRIFADMPRSTHNSICFQDRELEASSFIVAVKGVGTYDHTMSCGRRIWCRRDHRCMSVSRYSSTTCKRVTTLEERLSGPALDEVPGLLSLVEEQDWAKYNSLRVGDLLQKMVALHNRTRSKLDETERRLVYDQKAHDQLREDLGVAHDDLRNCEDQLHNSRFYLDEANKRLDSSILDLDDAHREVDYLNRMRSRS